MGSIHRPNVVYRSKVGRQRKRKTSYICLEDKVGSFVALTLCIVIDLSDYTLYTTWFSIMPWMWLSPPSLVNINVTKAKMLACPCSFSFEPYVHIYYKIYKYPQSLMCLLISQGECSISMFRCMILLLVTIYEYLNSSFHPHSQFSCFFIFDCSNGRIRQSLFCLLCLKGFGLQPWITSLRA